MEPLKNSMQVSLWDAPTPAVIWHQHMELHYQGGEREIVCCQRKPQKYRTDNIYAGFVEAVPESSCSICANLSIQKSITI